MGQPKERFKLIVEVNLVLRREGKILLSRRFQTGYEDGNYGLISGHVDGRETMREAMAREAKEEAGIIVNHQALKLLLTMHRWCGDHERLALFFDAEKWQGEIKNMEPEKCDDLNWFALDKLPDNMIPYISQAISCIAAGENYAEDSWENVNKKV